MFPDSLSTPDLNIRDIVSVVLRKFQAHAKCSAAYDSGRRDSEFSESSRSCIDTDDAAGETALQLFYSIVHQLSADFVCVCVLLNNCLTCRHNRAYSQ